MRATRKTTSFLASRCRIIGAPVITMPYARCAIPKCSLVQQTSMGSAHSILRGMVANKSINDECHLEDIVLKGAWTGPAALSLTPHALAPVAEPPVLEVVSAIHSVADLTLGLGKVVHDYL